MHSTHSTVSGPIASSGGGLVGPLLSSVQSALPSRVYDHDMNPALYARLVFSSPDARRVVLGSWDAFCMYRAGHCAASRRQLWMVKKAAARLIGNES